MSDPSQRSWIDKKRQIPAIKKLLFSFAVLVSAFATLELCLYGVGIKPLLYEFDPFVGFVPQLSLFSELTSVDGTIEMVTAENKRRWFNFQRFPRARGPESYRIFCVGGSTTFGRPYEDSTSFCGWMRAFLEEADPSTSWELINAGGISYASYRVAILIDELVTYQPDLVIVYSGHNEFLEDRTYGSIADTPAAIRRAKAFVLKTRIATLIRRAIVSLAPSLMPVLKSGSGLGEEVETMLDRSVGPEDFTRDDLLQEAVAKHFRYNLERIAKSVRDHGAEIVLVLPASNLRDASPFKSEHRTGLSDGDLRAWDELVSAADRAVDADQIEDALVLLDRAAGIDDRFADLHFSRGQVLAELERYAEARLAFVRARDEDVCALRAPSFLQRAVIEVGKDEEISVVDFAALAAELSESGIAGADLFLDHVHPTVRGNRELALAILKQLNAGRVLHRRILLTPDVVQRVTSEVEEGVDTRAQATALRNLSKVMGWAGKFQEAGRLAEKALELDSEDAEAQLNLGAAMAQEGRIDKALYHYRNAVRLGPNLVLTHVNLGQMLSELGDHQRAVFHLQRAVELDPEFGPAHSNLGIALHRVGDIVRAIGHYRRAIELMPDSAKTHNNLGTALESVGRLEEASTHYRRAVEIDPEYEAARRHLERVRRKSQ